MEAGAADIETGEAFDMVGLPCSINSEDDIWDVVKTGKESATVKVDNSVIDSGRMVNIGDNAVVFPRARVADAVDSWLAIQSESGSNSHKYILYTVLPIMPVLSRPPG